MTTPSIHEARQLTIGVHPFTNEGNEYIPINKDILGQLGSVVEVPRARVLLKRLLGQLIRFKSPKSFDVLILNWTELLILSRGNAPTLSGAISYLFLMRLCRWVAVKLIYVRHNDYPHDLPRRHQRQIRNLIAKGQRLADAVVAHSPVYAEEHGYHYVPHPLYRLDPGGQASECDEYVIFGRVMAYKKIDQLIEAWPSSQHLAVIGPFTDEDYLAKLRSMALDKPIRFDIGFHDEGALVDRLKASRGVIIVNDPGSLVVSGTFFFALSVGVGVLAINNSFYSWVKTTPLDEYVQSFDSIPALARHLQERPARESAQPELIRSEARRLFGDDAVLQAWRSLIC